MITKEKFEKYVCVQRSGATNMFDVPRVSRLSGLTREECFEIMKSYGELERKFTQCLIDLAEVREKLECSEIEWRYVENEGNERVRFDFGVSSFWINKDGSTDGLDTMPKAIQKIVKEALA